MENRIPVTVIILTKDEQQNIAPCIDTLAWADEVVVVDSFSKDKTVQCAKLARSDVRVFENPFKDFGQQRNWAIDHTSPQHDWILFLDADERSNDKFRDAIASTLQSPEKVGYFLCYRNYFLGKWLKRSTQFPSWQLRLFHRGQVRFAKMGHGQSEVTEGPLGYIQVPYDHFGFSKGLADWVDRHNRYSTAEASYFQALATQPLRFGDFFSSDTVTRKRCLKRYAARSLFRPFLKFFYLYIFRRGFLDGSAGLMFCALQFAQELHISAKMAEMASRARDESSDSSNPME